MDTAEPTINALQSLPVLPHPASLLLPGPFFQQEARAQVDKLAAWAKSVQEASLASSVPPLPPIPVPPTTSSTSRRRSSLPVAKSAKPNPHPHPHPHPQPRADAPHSSISTFIERWNERHDVPQSSLGQTTSASGPHAEGSTAVRCRATFERGRGAVFVELGDDRLEGSFWVLIDRRRGEEEQHVEEVRVRAVKLYSPAESRTTWAYRCLPSSGVVMEEDQADGAQTPLLHSISTSGPHAAFSKHLTGLHLTVPELLARAPLLPHLLTSPCFYCHKRLHVPEGLPTASGWVEPRRKKRKIRSDAEGAGTKNGKADGKKDEEDAKEESQEEKGRWACWHPGCEV
ncbi:hypothetical protein JCM24511_01372 [Saitozyma sp. JCM 24511]|nr:hypothetical protein JCM24511_01372 [Saitozyma sp. JCM 24511]